MKNTQGLFILTPNSRLLGSQHSPLASPLSGDTRLEARPFDILKEEARHLQS